MIISCTNCSTKYSADDSKVKNKKFSFVCPSCNTDIIIDNREIDEEETALTEEALPAEEEVQEEAVDEETEESLDMAFEEAGEAEDLGIEETVVDELMALADEDADIAEEAISIEEPIEEIVETGDLGMEDAEADELMAIEEEDITITEEALGIEIEEAGEVEDMGLEGSDVDELMALEEEGAEADELMALDEDVTITEDALGIEEPVQEEAIIDIAGEELPEDEDTNLDDEDSLKITIDQMGIEDEIEGISEEVEIMEGKEAEVEEDQMPEIMEESIEIDTELDESQMEISEEPIEIEAEMSEADITEEFKPLEEDVVSLETESVELSSLDEGKIDISEESLEDLSEEIDMEQTEKIDLDEVKSDEIFSQESDIEDVDNKDITIDLDSLDIQLEEEGAEEGISETIEGMDITQMEPMTQEETSGELDEDDSDITLDLDSLDLVLDEAEEIQEGEILDEDERLSLADAGLTPDELIDKEPVVQKIEEETEEDLRLSIDEVAPEIEEVGATAEISIMQEDEEEELLDLPEIDLEKFEREEMDLDITEDIELTEKKPGDFIDTETKADFAKYEEEIDSLEEESYDTVPEGLAHLSVDYSLKYSRIGALLRLCGLFIVGLLPHLVVTIIYSVLSFILGILNSAIISLTGESVEDFTEIIENTLRRVLSFGACMIDVVEDMPLFSGRKDIDYSLQFDVTYPVRYSRILAILRLSVVGILILALPHILLLVILSIGSIPICLGGIISIIVKKTWPNILFDSMVKYFSYLASVLSYIIGLVDKYPKFKFE